MKDNALPPNFDDERTLQTARQVVPLNQIEAKVRRRRHWFLGGAFAVAMTLGAASALLASYVRQRPAPAPMATEAAAEGDVPAAPVAVAANPLPTESPATEDTALETPKKEPVARRRAVVKHTEEPVDLSDDPHMTESERLQQIRDAVLYDKWQEQRARRVYRRERRLERYNHRDLSNLDE